MSIPRDLRRHFGGKSEIVKSLKTRDVKVAQPLALREAQKWQMHFLRLRSGRGSAELEPRLVYKEFRESRLAAVRESPLYNAPEGAEPNETLNSELNELAELEVDLIVQDEEEKRGLRFWERESVPTYLMAQIDGVRDAYRIARGLKPENERKYEPPFQEVAEEWLEQWKQRPSRKQTNTAAQYAATIRLFSEWWGRKPIRKVEKQHAAQFVEKVLKRLPPNYGRSERLRAQNLNELLSGAPRTRSGLSASTINRHIGTLKAIWKWAKNLDLCEGENPFDGFSEKLTKHNQQGYLAWEIDELQRLLNPPPKRWDLYELILVAMYSAMRVNEIASLTWGDLRQGENGIWYFRVIDAKTDAGRRIIPVHSRLSWITKRERGPEEKRIWPRFNEEGPGKKPGADASRMFSDFKIRRGFKDRRKTFHSFRKNVTAMMENASVPPNQWARIIGHEPGFTYGTYNPHGLTLERMKDIIEIIHYDGLEYEEPQP